MKLPYYIAIEGNIGIGKSSLAKILGTRLDAKLVLEKFEENPFLVDFYNNPERFAFQTQLFFLLSRYRQQQALNQIDLFFYGQLMALLTIYQNCNSAINTSTRAVF